MNASPEKARDASVLGIKLLIAADAATFGALVVGALISRFEYGWSGSLDGTRALVLTAMLAAVSGLLIAARGRRTALVVAGVIGLAFCLMTALEWRALAAEHVVFGAGRKTDWFYVISAYHAAHVLAGALALLWFARRAAAGATGTVLSWYWHFVDAVWLLIAALFYL